MFKKITNWIASPEYPQDRERTRSATLLNIILWMFIITASGYGVLAPIEPEMRIRRLSIIGTFILTLFILKYTLNLGYTKTTANLVVFSVWLIFSAAMFYGADYNNPAYMGYLIVVVTAGLVLNWRSSISWGILSIITNAILITLGQKGYLPVSHGETPPFAFWAAQTAYIIVTTVLLSQAIRKIDESFENAQHEIRERKRVEAERETFIKELESKNAELERFTYTVSHDLKSPLITISGYAGFLEEDVQSNQMGKFKNDVQRIREATKKMQELLNDLLDLSRVGQLMNPAEEVSFNQIAQDAISILEISLTEKKIKVQVQEDMPTVYVDRIRLVEVMQNLIDNATKFIGTQPNPIIEIGTVIQNNEEVFYIKDNGIGIDPIHHQRVFGLFNKLNPDTDGTGIGLALVKRTIEIHNGKIWIDSNVGQGTAFYFTLPRKDL